MGVLLLFGFALLCLLMVSVVRFLFLEKHIMLVSYASALPKNNVLFPILIVCNVFMRTCIFSNRKILETQESRPLLWLRTAAAQRARKSQSQSHCTAYENLRSIECQLCE